MHPILFQFGPFRLPTYGLLVAAALVAAVYTVVRLGKREGLDTGRLFDLSTWLILVALVGAKVLMILADWSFYRQNPGEILSWTTLQAGGVFYGGFLAAVLFGAYYVRAYRLPAGKIFDIYAPAIALGQSVGRLGCFAAGCDYGSRSASFLHVTFTDRVSHDLTGVPLGVPLHPTQIYESLATFFIFGILLWRYPRKSRDGQIFLLYMGLYALARFFIEFLRGDEDRGFVFNHLLSTSQFIAILAALAAIAVAYSMRRRPAEPSQPSAASATKRTGRVIL